MKVAILGAGAWGTALAIALAQNHSVRLWARDAVLCQVMQQEGENRKYLPGSAFPAQLQVLEHFSSAVQAVDLILIATPLAGLRSSLQLLRQHVVDVPFLWLCKGLEATTGLLPHQVAAQEMPEGGQPYGALTGPSFAEEVARALPTAITLASGDAVFARTMAQALSGPRLRIYANDDVVGAEVGGAVKNILAIAIGISDGLGLGLNARAALMTRGLAEVVRFGLALGAKKETLMGLAGMGDLILTCTGDLSRNRRVGLGLAKGQALAQITQELGHVAEGVPSAREVARRAQVLGVEMPITQAVCDVLDGRLAVLAAVEQLMRRDTKEE